MPQARLKTRKIEEYDLIDDLPPAQSKHNTIDQRSGQAGSRQRATNLESLDMSNSNLKDGIQFRKIDDSINDGLSPHVYDQLQTLKTYKNDSKTHTGQVALKPDQKSNNTTAYLK